MTSRQKHHKYRKCFVHDNTRPFPHETQACSQTSSGWSCRCWIVKYLLSVRRLLLFLSLYKRPELKRSPPVASRLNVELQTDTVTVLVDFSELVRFGDEMRTCPVSQPSSTSSYICLLSAFQSKSALRGPGWDFSPVWAELYFQKDSETLLSIQWGDPPTKYTECWSVGMCWATAGHTEVRPLSAASPSKSLFVGAGCWLAARVRRVLLLDRAEGLKQLFGPRSSADGLKYDPGLILRVPCSCAHPQVWRTHPKTLYI